MDVGVTRRDAGREDVVAGWHAPSGEAILEAGPGQRVGLAGRDSGRDPGDKGGHPLSEEPPGGDITRVVHPGVDPGEADGCGEGIDREPHAR